MYRRIRKSCNSGLRISSYLCSTKKNLDTLKADGIKLATNVQGQYLGATEPDLAPYRDMVLWKNARRLFPTSRGAEGSAWIQVSPP